MATEVVKSAFIIAADTTPSGLPSAILNGGGDTKIAMATLAAAGGTTGSVYRFIRVPTKARIHRVEFANADVSSDAATVHLGVYRTVADGSAAVDADLFASALDVATAAVRADRTFESLVFTIDDIEKELWDAAGVSADPGGFYDICATSAAGTCTGVLSLWVTYII